MVGGLRRGAGLGILAALCSGFWWWFPGVMKVQRRHSGRCLEERLEVSWCGTWWRCGGDAMGDAWRWLQFGGRDVVVVAIWWQGRGGGAAETRRWEMHRDVCTLILSPIAARVLVLNPCISVNLLLPFDLPLCFSFVGDGNFANLVLRSG